MMHILKKLVFILPFFYGVLVSASHAPVTPDATEESVSLLEYLYDISGKKTLSGQHDYPMSSPFFTRFAKEITGSFPAVYGRDFGFSAPDTLDGINYRQKIIDEVIESHQAGAIITLMWHAAPPTQREPVEFKSGIQSELTDEQWTEMITEGTEINLRWKSQVDVIASYLLQLKIANIPVIWRPYHEMNGAWFWWGDKPGKMGYQKLYRMLYDRLVNYHGLNNLLWVFNGNQVSDHVKPYALYYPGDDVVDILATDVYGEFVDTDYDQLIELAKGRPIALGEIGPFPSPEYLDKHSAYAWFMSWSEFLLKTDRAKVKALYEDDRVLNRDEVEY